MPTPDEFVRALRNERAYAADHPILGRSPVTAPPVLGPEAAWRALGAPDPLNLQKTYQSAHPMEAAQNTLEGLINMIGPLPAKGAALGAAAALPALVRYGSQAAEHATPFYSAAERAIGEAGLNKAPLAQWLATLRNKGVKEEELNWLGLGKAPVGDTPGWTGHVTKEQLNDWVKGHGVQLREVQRRSEPSGADLEALAAHHYERGYDELDPGRQEGLRREWAQGRGGAGASPTKFQQYQLPGGTNYRETLLTLPQQENKVDPTGWTARKNKGETDWSVRDASGNLINSLRINARNEQDAINQAVEHARTGRSSVFRFEYPQRNFTGSHWDEPNVLAHVRHNDRTLPPAEAGGDPRKALFLEEVQSDWGQQGRKKGFKDAQPPQLDFRNFDTFATEKGYNREQKQAAWQNLNDPVYTEWDQVNKDAMQKQVDYNSRVPNMPFKQSWSDLALKRMLAKAAHEGYDALAWTPGEVQAARYDLSKQLDGLLAVRNPDGTFNLSAKMPGRAVYDHDLAERVPAEKLPDYIGKDLAEKVAAQKGTPVNVGDNQHTYEGLDLKVGGEGMRAFYDKMLVDKANALGKRYGAKVRQEPIDSPLERREGPNADLGVSGEEWNALTPEQKATHEKQTAHVLPITPELREAAKKGFPLFATGGLTAASAAGGGDAEPIALAAKPPPDENARMLNALRGQPGEL
jgi:hypothetical protein